MVTDWDDDSIEVFISFKGGTITLNEGTCRLTKLKLTINLHQSQ